MIMIEPGDPMAPGAKALLEQSHALMNSMFPSGECHFLDLDALQAPHIRFFVAREGDAVIGTGALSILGGYGEVKSMFTDAVARGKGAAAAILRVIEDTARDEGLPWLRLETGVGLDAAHRLYEKHGFAQCDPFGSYELSEWSLYYEKALT